MKFSKYLACIAAACSFYACDDAGYSAITNGIYIAEAAPSDKFNQQIENLLIDDGQVNLELNIRMAAPAEQDTKVRLYLDTTLITKYNEEHSANYLLLPKQYREFVEEVTIPAGETSAPPAILSIKPYTSPNNEVYAMPIRIAVDNSSVPVVGNADKLLYLLTTPNKQHSVVLGSGEVKTVFKNPIPTTAWTFEYWIKVNNKTGQATGDWVGINNKPFRNKIFTDNSAPIHLNQGEAESIYLRYWADGVKKIAPTLQCQLNGPFLDSNEFWWPDTWYHIAYTYDGTTLTLYKDGVQDGTKLVEKKFDFNNIVLCSSFGSQMEVELAQIRLWNKCQPANVIQDGMSRQLPADSEGLIGYWKCDENSGKELKDCTEYGNSINLSSKSNVKWSEAVYNFSHPNKKN